MGKVTIYIDETTLSQGQKATLETQLQYWRTAGFTTEIGPPAKPRP